MFCPHSFVDQNKQRLFLYTALTDGFYNRYGVFTIFKCARNSGYVWSSKSKAY